MTTQIAALPLLSAALVSATNEDWTASFAFAAGLAGAAAARSVGNVGNGGIGAVAVNALAPLGVTIVEIGAAPFGTPVATGTPFEVTDASGNLLGVGTVGAAFDAGGLAFELAQGTIVFAPGDSFAITVAAQPIDLTGIGFALGMRTDPLAGTLALSASTAAATLVGALFTGAFVGSASTLVGGLVVGGPGGGSAGTLGLSIPKRLMRLLAPRPYVFDILAFAETTKRCVGGTLDLQAGIAP